VPETEVPIAMSKKGMRKKHDVDESDDRDDNDAPGDQIGCDHADFCSRTFVFFH